MNKKIVVPILAAIFLAAVTLAEAQQPKKAPRIGFLGQSKHSSLRGQAVTAFRQKLRELGWVEGENIIIEWRFAEGVEEAKHAFGRLLDRDVGAAVVVYDRWSRISGRASSEESVGELRLG